MQLVPPKTLAELSSLDKSQKYIIEDAVFAMQHCMECLRLMDICAPRYETDSSVWFVAEILRKLHSQYSDIYHNLLLRIDSNHIGLSADTLQKAAATAVSRQLTAEKLGVDNFTLEKFRIRMRDLSNYHEPESVSNLFGRNVIISEPKSGDLKFIGPDGSPDGLTIHMHESTKYEGFSIGLYKQDNLCKWLDSGQVNDGPPHLQVDSAKDQETATNAPPQATEGFRPFWEGGEFTYSRKLVHLKCRAIDKPYPENTLVVEACDETTDSEDSDGISGTTAFCPILGGLLVKTASAGRRKKDIKHEEVFEKEA